MAKAYDLSCSNSNLLPLSDVLEQYATDFDEKLSAGLRSNSGIVHAAGIGDLEGVSWHVVDEARTSEAQLLDAIHLAAARGHAAILHALLRLKQHDGTPRLPLSSAWAAALSNARVPCLRELLRAMLTEERCPEMSSYTVGGASAGLASVCSLRHAMKFAGSQALLEFVFAGEMDTIIRTHSTPASAAICFRRPFRVTLNAMAKWAAVAAGAGQVSTVDYIWHMVWAGRQHYPGIRGDVATFGGRKGWQTMSERMQSVLFSGLTRLLGAGKWALAERLLADTCLHWRAAEAFDEAGCPELNLSTQCDAACVAWKAAVEAQASCAVRITHHGSCAEQDYMANYTALQVPPTLAVAFIVCPSDNSTAEEAPVWAMLHKACGYTGKQAAEMRTWLHALMKVVVSAAKHKLTLSPEDEARLLAACSAGGGGGGAAAGPETQQR